MEQFKKELADLLTKYDIATICHSNNDINDYSVEIGFQEMKNGFKNTYTGRHHLGGFDLKIKEDNNE